MQVQSSLVVYVLGFIGDHDLLLWDGVHLNYIAYAGSEISSPVDSWVYQDLSS